jgi:hypothetical protein
MGGLKCPRLQDDRFRFKKKVISVETTARFAFHRIALEGNGLDDLVSCGGDDSDLAYFCR